MLSEAENRALYDSAQAEALLRHLAQCATQAGIELLVVKGPALGHGGIYPAPHARPVSDVDLVCLPADRTRLVRHLLADGFVNAEPEYPVAYYLRYRGEVALWRPDSPRWPCVEVHWGAAGGLYFGRHLPARRLLDSSVPGFWGPGLRVLAPEMEFAHAVAHLAKHVRAMRPVWALDLALLARRGLDWARVTAILRRARLHRVAVPVLSWVAERVPGAGPPRLLGNGVLQRGAHSGWRSGGNGGRLSWTEARMLHAGGSGIGRWIEAMSLPTWRQRLGYLGETLAPRRAVMERLYPQARGRALWLFHLRRWGRLLLPWRRVTAQERGG